MPAFMIGMTPAPARVHPAARQLSGHFPCWIRKPYRGEIYRQDHFRRCSYCGCIHPADLIDLLRAGGSALEQSGKPGKLILLTPNPIAGELCRMGSSPGPIFERSAWPQTLRDRLRQAPAPGLEFQPSMGERAACHFERPSLEPAPALISQPFFIEHSSEPQWAEIEAAAATGEQHDAASISSP